MRIDKIDNTKFTAIKYLERPISSAINTEIKNVVDKNPLFAEISSKTDVFITTGSDNAKKNSFWYLVADFKTTINNQLFNNSIVLMEHAQTEESWFDKLREMLECLPKTYEEVLSQNVHDNETFFINNVNGFVLLEKQG